MSNPNLTSLYSQLLSIKVPLPFICMWTFISVINFTLQSICSFIFKMWYYKNVIISIVSISLIIMYVFNAVSEGGSEPLRHFFNILQTFYFKSKAINIRFQSVWYFEWSVQDIVPIWNTWKVL